MSLPNVVAHVEVIHDDWASRFEDMYGSFHVDDSIICYDYGAPNTSASASGEKNISGSGQRENNNSSSALGEKNSSGSSLGEKNSSGSTIGEKNSFGSAAGEKNIIDSAQGEISSGSALGEISSGSALGDKRSTGTIHSDPNWFHTLKTSFDVSMLCMKVNELYMIYVVTGICCV